jgi:hypothetical protein
MGDRAILILVNRTTGDVGAEVYLHWNGRRVPHLIASLASLMANRKGDVAYATARLIGLAHEMLPGNLSLGVSLTQPALVSAIRRRDNDFLCDYSPGDAGLVVIDAATFEWEAHEGYLAAFLDAA